MDLYSQKQRWKRLLILLALGIGIGSLLYTNRLVERLAEQERAKVQLWAKGTTFLANSADTDADLSFVFDVVRDNSTIPLILTDGDGHIISVRNLDPDRSAEQRYREEMLGRIRGRNEPIVIDLYGGSKNFIHYDNSPLYYQLKYYPYVSLGVIGVFILVSYLAFSFSRRAEQDRVWAGMAKETAHQLGTPLMSLMAWLEYLRMKGVDEETLDDMGRDVRRLETITERFSKIGSQPELSAQPLAEVMEEALGYMRSRSSKKVTFDIRDASGRPLSVPLNVPLFAWVVENLCRNAIDAMEGAGSITVRLSAEGGKAIIDVADTGKGIPKSMFETVFEPGYTSKKRGWGLGLSLSRRIIEQYHGGRIHVLRSEAGKGTTFRISLPLA